MSACFLFIGLELWSSTQNRSIRELAQAEPRLIGASCGLLLFVASAFSFKSAPRLAFYGLIVGIAAMYLAFLPVLAV
jgi:hypothetical protein